MMRFVLIVLFVVAANGVRVLNRYVAAAMNVSVGNTSAALGTGSPNSSAVAPSVPAAPSDSSSSSEEEEVPPPPKLYRSISVTRPRCRTARATELKVATWNLACLDLKAPGKIAELALVQDADIILTQEGVETEDGKGPALVIPGYTEVSTCRGEKLWPEMEAYKQVDGRYLQNSVYVLDESIEVVSVRAASLGAQDSKDDVPRCAAIAEVKPKCGPKSGPKSGTSLTVASIHLSGGRFVDDQWEVMGDVKVKEVENVLKENVDIVAGDLNSYASEDQVARAQQSYPVYKKALEESKQQGYLQYATAAVKAMSKPPMRRIDVNGDTTQYGGTVDHIFINTLKISVPKTKFAQMVRQPCDGMGCTGKMCVAPKPAFTFSDHNPVVATLVVE